MTGYRPWEAPPQDAPASSDEAPKPDAVFQAPPGLPEAQPTTAKPKRGNRLAAAMLLGVAGFLFFSGLAGLIGTGIAIDVQDIDQGGHDPDLDEVRSLMAWPLLIGLFMAVPPVALLLEAPWARPLMLLGGILALLPPFTLWGVLSLYNLEPA